MSRDDRIEQNILFIVIFETIGYRIFHKP